MARTTTKKGGTKAKKPATRVANKTKAAKVTTKPVKTQNNEYSNLNRWNRILAALHGVQGIIILLLAGSATFPVSTNYLTLNPLASAGGQPVLVAGTRNLFAVNLALLVALFFFMSAIAHLVIATRYRARYEADLGKGINKARWIEYSLSASVMMVAIAMLSGVQDLSSLIMIFGLTSIMNLMGLMMEVHNQTTNKTNWLSYLIGCKAGILPWLVVVIYLVGSGVYGSGNIPTFVYWIFASMMLFFSSFAVNMYLQYKKSGRWADYLYGEKVYMILSLVAKTLLAWQVFFGALRP